MDDSISSAELADILGVSERQIRSLVEKGVLTAWRNAKGHYRFELSTAKAEFDRYNLKLGRGARAMGAARPRSMEKVSAKYAEEGYKWQAETWWIARKELLAYPGRVLARLFDADEKLIVIDLDSIRAILEGEACECMNEIESYDMDDPIFELQNSCPYSGFAHNYECACDQGGGGCYMTRKAFESCLVSPYMLGSNSPTQSTQN